MLDTGFHQAAGLNSFTPQAQLRVLAVASQERASSGLEMLWQICANLQRLGYPVAVLDGTALETDESPGLSHLLQAPWNDGLNASASVTSVAVLPAARGMLQLQRQAYSEGTPPLQSLQPYFRAYGMLVLHAPAGLLAPLLTHTSTIPLAVMEGGAAGVLSCYKSLQTHRHAHGVALYSGVCAANRYTRRTTQSAGSLANAAGLCRASSGRARAHHHRVGQ